MVGTIIVSLGDSQTGLTVASNPLLGDILALASAALYAVYITLIRKKLPDDDGKSGQASMAQFLGFLGLFNLLIFLPVALILNFTKLEPFNLLTWEQLGLIIGKGLYLSFHFYYYFYFLVGDIFVFTWVGVGGWVGGRAGGCGCYYYYYSWLSVTFFKRVVLNNRLIPLCVCVSVCAQQNIFINHILGFLLHIIYKTKSRYKLSCSHWLQLHLISYYWMRNLTNSLLDYVSSYIFHA